VQACETRKAVIMDSQEVENPMRLLKDILKEMQEQRRILLDIEKYTRGVAQATPGSGFYRTKSDCA